MLAMYLSLLFLTMELFKFLGLAFKTLRPAFLFNLIFCNLPSPILQSF